MGCAAMRLTGSTADVDVDVDDEEEVAVDVLLVGSLALLVSVVLNAAVSTAANLLSLNTHSEQ